MEGYKTLEVIGSGSYGTVYLVSDERNRKYALKKVEVNAFTAEDALKEIEVLVLFALHFHFGSVVPTFDQLLKPQFLY